MPPRYPIPASANSYFGRQDYQDHYASRPPRHSSTIPLAPQFRPDRRQEAYDYHRQSEFHPSFRPPFHPYRDYRDYDEGFGSYQRGEPDYYPVASSSSSSAPSKRLKPSFVKAKHSSSSKYDIGSKKSAETIDLVSSSDEDDRRRRNKKPVVKLEMPDDLEGSAVHKEG
jgi:hypothetical protein